MGVGYDGGGGSVLPLSETQVVQRPESHTHRSSASRVTDKNPSQASANFKSEQISKNRTGISLKLFWICKKLDNFVIILIGKG